MRQMNGFILLITVSGGVSKHYVILGLAYCLIYLVALVGKPDFNPSTSNRRQGVQATMQETMVQATLVWWECGSAPVQWRLWGLKGHPSKDN
jgi:hypothetical protein